MALTSWRQLSLHRTSWRATIRLLQPMNRRQYIKRTRSAVRIIVAVLLTAAFVCAVVPLASVSASNVCRLECCAARAPHAAGSCMNGTCHAAIKLHKKFQRSAVSVSEEFCGLKRLASRLGLRPAANDSAHTDTPVGKLAQTCAPDCGGCAVGSVSAKGKATAGAAHEPLSLLTFSAINVSRSAGSAILSLEYSPRGPPEDFSA